MDEQTFSALFEATRGALLAYLRRTSGDETLAEDLFQESYIRLLSHPPLILESGTAMTGDLPVTAVRRWLFTTATRLLRDHWRRDRWHRWIPWVSSDEDEDDREIQYASDAPLPDRTLSGHEAVAAGFARLSPRQRSLLWLALVEGLDHAELARLFDVSRASVRVLLHRARTRMGDSLRNLGVEGSTW